MGLAREEAEGFSEPVGESVGESVDELVGDATIAVNAAVPSSDSVDEDQHPVSDHTVAVNAPRDAAADLAADDGTGGSSEMLEDRTMVVNRPHEVVSDGTVVVNRPHEAVGDGTVVVNRPVEPLDDGTVVVNHPRGGAGDEAPAPAAPQRRRDRRAQVSGGSNPAPPVEAPKEKRSLRRIIGGGLDPKRPIAQAPGSMPWEQQPVGERGVAQGLTVSYGARVRTEMPLQTGVDEVQRRVGPAPEAQAVRVVEGREALPSLSRRDRKRRLVTLAIYLGVTLACALGLVGVASIAFGW